MDVQRSQTSTTARCLQLRAPRVKALSAAIAVACALAVPVAGLGAECEGDECQGPPPAPEEIVPGTAAVVAPGNPPVHYPKERHHRRHHKHRHGSGR
jgi:hypothetical protein